MNQDELNEDRLALIGQLRETVRVPVSDGVLFNCLRQAAWNPDEAINVFRSGPWGALADKTASRFPVPSRYFATDSADAGEHPAKRARLSDLLAAGDAARAAIAGFRPASSLLKESLDECLRPGASTGRGRQIGQMRLKNTPATEQTDAFSEPPVPSHQPATPANIDRPARIEGPAKIKEISRDVRIDTAFQTTLPSESHSVFLGTLPSCLFASASTSGNFSAEQSLPFEITVSKPALRQRGGRKSFGMPFLRWTSGRGWLLSPHLRDLLALGFPLGDDEKRIMSIESGSTQLFQTKDAVRGSSPSATGGRADTTDLRRTLLDFCQSSNPSDRLSAIVILSGTLGATAAKTKELSQKSAISVLAGGTTLGRLPKDVSAVLTPLFVLGLLAFCVRLSDDTQRTNIQLGDTVPLRISLFASTHLFSTNAIRHLAPEAQTVLSAAVRSIVEAAEDIQVLPRQQPMESSTPSVSPSEVDEEPQDTSELDAGGEDDTQTAAVLGTAPVAAAGPETTPDPLIFRSQLHSYQKQALSWLLARESDGAVVCPSGDVEPPLPWERILLPVNSPGNVAVTKTEDGKNRMAYFNPVAGRISLEFPAGKDTPRGGILADEMGLGKTVQLLALISRDFRMTPDDPNAADVKKLFKKIPAKKEVPSETTSGGSLERLWRQEGGKPHGGTLLVLPLSLLDQWRSEIFSHFCLAVVPLEDDAGEQQEKLRVRNPLQVEVYYGQSRGTDFGRLINADIVLTTYGTMQSEWTANRSKKAVGPIGKTPPSSPLWKIVWHRVVLDEAHLIKGRFTRTCRAACALEAVSRWCLTGTPIQNSVSDVYSLLHFLRVEPWKQWTAFHQAVLLPYERGDTETALKSLHSLLTTILLRRTRCSRDTNGKPIITLPPQVVQTVLVTFSCREKEFYDALFQRASSRFTRLLRSGRAMHNYTHILEMLLRLRQSCCHPLIAFWGQAMAQGGLRNDNLADMEEEEMKASFASAVKEEPQAAATNSDSENQAEQSEFDIMAPSEAIDYQGSTEQNTRHSGQPDQSNGNADDRHTMRDQLRDIALEFVSRREKRHRPMVDRTEQSGTNAEDVSNKDMRRNEFHPAESVKSSGPPSDPVKAETAATAACLALRESPFKAPGVTVCDICGKEGGDVFPCGHILCEAGAACRVRSGDEGGCISCPLCGAPGTIAVDQAAIRRDHLECVGLANGSSHLSLRLSAKLELLFKFLQGDRQTGVASVVFTQWTSYMNIVEMAFQYWEIPYRRFDGSMNANKRKEALDWFASTVLGRSPFCVLLVSLKAGGVGLNLTAACRGYILDQWWNPATMQQAMQRLHRIGQTRKVEIFHFIVKGTVEERIVELHARKDSDARSALNDKTAAGIASTSATRLDDLQFVFQQ